MFNKKLRKEYHCEKKWQKQQTNICNLDKKCLDMVNRKLCSAETLDGGSVITFGSNYLSAENDTLLTKTFEQN